MTIGEALKDERLKLNLTQKEMAANIMSRSQYGKVEKDLHDISASVYSSSLNFTISPLTSFLSKYYHHKQEKILKHSYYMN